MRYMIRWSVAAMLGAALVTAACTTPTDTSPTSVQLTGSWRYMGVQTSGARITYDGTMTLSQPSGRTFSGGLDAQAQDAQGIVTRVNGVVSGRVVSESSLDFDLQLSDDVRRHVGSVSADTIKGNWANADLTSLGTFTAVRVK